MGALAPPIGELHGDPPLYLTAPVLSRAGLPHLFSTRNFPGIRPWRDPRGPFEDGAVELIGAQGIDGGPIAFLAQVHGADVAVAARGGLVGRADVVVTDRPGLPLAIFTADCVAVVVYDPRGRRLAMAHAGWRGTVLGAARAAARALVEAGGRASDLVAAMGPSIGPCCYEVDAPVIDQLSAAFPGTWEAWVTPTVPGKWMLDLWRANLDQLRDAGLDPAQIENAGLCTACRQDLFYSYRRGRGQGRLVAVAAIPSASEPAC